VGSGWRLDKLFTVSTVVALLGFHAVLGLVAEAAPVVATVHGILVGGTLLVLAAVSKRVDRIFAITVYASLCDLFWRMTGSKAPWEFSKYLLIVGSVAILLRFARPWTRAAIPITFLACLVPGLVMTVMSNGVVEGKDQIADFGLGAIALGVAVLAFRQLVISETEGWNLGWIMLAPIMTALAITLRSSLRLGVDAFNGESSFAATGGFGPNQVSSALGLGILICVLLALQRRGAQYLGILVGLGFLLTWATFVTFSRGGLYTVVIAGGALLLVGVWSRGHRFRSGVTIAVAVVGLFMMYSSVNDFSGSWLDTRYEGGNRAEATTGRSDLVEQDVGIFLAHPIWGVGIGGSDRYHRLAGHVDPVTHTEQARLLAEHGLFGLTGIGLLLAMAVGGFRESRSQWNRMFVVATFAWGFTTMLHAATRLGAVSLLIALSQLRIEPDTGQRARR
jgi:O-antigen ligase